MLQSNKCYKVTNVTKYQMLQITKCCKVYIMTKYYRIKCINCYKVLTIQSTKCYKGTKFIGKFTKNQLLQCSKCYLILQSSKCHQVVNVRK